MVRVRFAPAPTGELHLGNIRTALFDWLFARHEGGKFILRIEDTDPERSQPDSISRIYSSLRWMGIEWDEGPVAFEGDDKPGQGEFGPYLQSQRGAIYRERLEELKARGMTYPCYCNDEEIQAERERAIRARRPYRYSGRCLKLSDAERDDLIKQGRKPALRFRVKRQTIVFDDLVRGKLSFNTREFGDFIIQRKDGSAPYNFAVVVDDHLMHISHVIRGEDHISNTPKQIILYRAFGWEPPYFAHLPLITGSDQQPLSKREGEVSLESFREKGYIPQAMVNYLALLGWSSPDGGNLLSAEEIIEKFSLDRVHKSPARFNLKRLRWINGKTLRGMGKEELLNTVEPFLYRAGYDLGGIDRNRLADCLDSIRDNLELAADAVGALELFLEKEMKLTKAARKILSKKQAGGVIKEMISELETRPALNQEIFYEIMSSLMEKFKLNKKSLYMLIRAGVTGRTMGPELVRIAELFTRDEWISRMKKALEVIKN